jgi:hypothetical protein
MAADRFLDATTLWPTLSRLAKAARGPKLVAAPYLTPGGAKSLHLTEGDVLLVALTIENCKSGSVCPAEIRKLQRKGVRVYIGRRLHAKVYLFAPSAIVCSANLSSNSKTLDEAGIVTKDPRVLRSIRAWFDERQGEPVTPEWLATCAKAYCAPTALKPTSDAADRVSPLWIIGTRDTVHPEDEAAVAARGEAKAKTRLINRRRFEIECIRWKGTDSFTQGARPGDLVITVDEKDGAYPHARILNIELVRGARSPVRYVYLEALKGAQPRGWPQFRARLGSLGLRRLGEKLSLRTVKDPQIRSKLISIMSPERWS